MSNLSTITIFSDVPLGNSCYWSNWPARTCPHLNRYMRGFNDRVKEFFECTYFNYDLERIAIKARKGTVRFYIVKKKCRIKLK